MKKHICLALLLLAFSASLTGQSEILNRKVKIENKEGTIGSILDEISREGGFVFSYSQDIPRKKKVSVQYSRQTVQQYLNEIFKEKIYCVTHGNKLLIKLKPVLPEFYTVQGKVIDSGNGFPVPGVTVIIPGTDPLIGAVSDDSGRFQINVPTGMDVIQFSCVGYERLNLNPEYQETGTIGLKPRSMEISEAVIEYGRLPVKIESSVAISYISGDKLKGLQGGSMEDALQGSVSGVHVVRNSGIPGASFQVQIRGNHSLINSDPVFYLDGIPLQQSLLYSLSGQDIASIEIFKDASSTSIYGASAGNGVVLLHSKKGSADKLDVNLNYRIGSQKAYRELDLMDSEEFYNFSKKVRPQDGEFDWLDEAYDEYDNDWMKLMFHPAKIEDFHFSISGGNEGSQYYLGTGLFNQASIIKELKFNRISLKFNSRHRVTKRWRLGHDLNFAHMTYKGLREGCFLNDHNNPVIQSLTMLPMYSPGDTLIDPKFSAFLPGGSIPAKGEPIEYVDQELTNNLRENYVIFGQLHSKVNVSRNISFESLFGYEIYHQNNRSCNRSKSVMIPITYNPIMENDYQVLDLAYHWHNHLHLFKTYAKDHMVKASIGYETGMSENQWIPVQQRVYAPADNEDRAKFYLNEDIQDLRCGINFRHHAALATAGYTYKERYIINGALRRETVKFDSTEFNKQQYSDWYPSVSLGWIFVQRKSNTPKKILHYGKLRYAYGVAGNSPTLNSSFHSKLMRDMSYAYSFSSAGNITNSYTQRQANALFYLEKVAAHNLGVEIGLFQNRLFVSTDVFRNHLHKGETSGYADPLNFLGQLFGRNSVGMIPLPMAEIVNSGIESTVSFKNRGHLLSWDLSLHLTHLYNRIVDIDSSDFASINNSNYDPISVNLPGETAGSFYGYKIERLFREEDCPPGGEKVTNQPYIIDNKGIRKYAQADAEAGDYKFVDINNDSIIDEYDKTIIGNPHPDFIFGISANIQFRQFDLSMFWQGTYGNEIYNATNLWLYNPYSTTNWSKDILNSYGTPQYDDSDQLIGIRTDTDLHRFDYNAENKNLRVSDFYIEDGSYLRLKNIQVGYTFDPALSGKIHIEKLRIYICAQNLLTFTNYSGLDPEVGGWGIDCGIYPQPRTFIAGINIGF